MSRTDNSQQRAHAQVVDLPPPPPGLTWGVMAYLDRLVEIANFDEARTAQYLSIARRIPPTDALTIVRHWRAVRSGAIN